MSARRLCPGCNVVRTPNPLCAGCAAAEYDTESPWDLQPHSHSESNAAGYWRQRRGTKEWVPLLVEELVLEPGERACQGCGEAFKPSHGLQRYHSGQCRKRVAYLALKARAPKPGRPVEAKAKDRQQPLPKTNTLRQFTDDECRDGRARWAQGDRSPETVARNREYGRVMTAARRQRRHAAADEDMEEAS
jgi:hypothetical protein